MAKATRFDLSRLEGCTGTISDAPTATRRSLRPAPAPTAPAPTTPAAPGPVDEGTSGSAAPTARTARTAPADEPSSPALRPAPTRHDHDPAVATPAIPSPRHGAATDRSTAESAEVAGDDREPQDRVRLGVILALTLSAWIPVLLIWWARLG